MIATKLYKNGILNDRRLSGTIASSPIPIAPPLRAAASHRFLSKKRLDIS